MLREFVSWLGSLLFFLLCYVCTLYTCFCADFSYSQEDINTLLYGLSSKFYGITNPHLFQCEAAKSALFGMDVIVVQPTGRGKSLLPVGSIAKQEVGTSFHTNRISDV